MRGFRVVLWLCIATASAITALGCTSVTWTGGRHVQYRMPQRFYLWIDGAELGEDERRLATLELGNALHRDIWLRGYDVDLVTTVDGRDRYPRVEVLVRNWKSGSEQVQLFKGFGEAQIDADCSVRLSPTVGPVFQGQLHARLDLSGYGPSSTGAFDAAAEVIAEAVLGPNVGNRPAPTHSAPTETAPPAPSNVAHTVAPLVLATHSQPASSSVPRSQPAPAAPGAPAAALPVTAASVASPPVASFPLQSQTTTTPTAPTMSFPSD